MAMRVFLAEKQINGTVRDALSGKAIPAATLEIANIRVETDRYGRFSTALNQFADVRVQALANGYLPAAFSFDVPWYLKIGKIDVQLMPVGFSVKVFDAQSGDPLPQATITLGNETFFTDAEGMLEIMPFRQQPPLPLSVEAIGYDAWHRKLMRLPQDSSELPLIVPLEPHILLGTVVAADTGEPLADVPVVIAGYTLRTDGRGQYSVAKLAPGTTIAVQPADFFYPEQFIFNGEAEITISLTPRTIAVQVLDAVSGNPIKGATVRFAQNQAVTGRQGNATFTRTPQLGNLIVSHPAYAPLTLLVNKQPSVVAKLRPNSLQGIIRDAVTKEPLPQTDIHLNGYTLSTGKQGEYVLPDLSQPLTITLKAMGYRPATFSTVAEGNNIGVSVAALETQPCQSSVENSSAALCIDLLLEPFDAKGIYIPFALLSQYDTIINLMDMVARTELNAVVIDVKSDRGSLAWDSQVPLADALGVDGNREGWMTLAEFLAEAKARDIYTIARIVTFKDNPLAFGRPDLATKYADGTIWVDGEGLAWANPFDETVWDYNIGLAKEIAAMGFDEINLDYLRFPSDGNIGAIVYPQENTAETRTTAIRTFVSRMRQALEPYGVYLSADVFGLTVWVDPDSDMNIGQRVKDIAPYVDYLSPMVYPSTFIPGNLGYDDPSAYPYQVIYRSQLAAMERVAAPTKVRPWLQAYWYSPYEMLLQKQGANDAGSAGWIWWNAGAVYDESVFVP